jgi:uncharacterized protein
MSKKSSTSAKANPPVWCRGTDVPMSLIRQFAQEVAERFEPEKVILFGSYACGTTHANSDVDILVVMPARNEINQATRIDRAIEPLFPLDLIVCTPKNISWRLKEGDSFLHEIMAKGKVLYEKADGPVGAKGRIRLCRSQENRTRKRSAS